MDGVTHFQYSYSLLRAYATSRVDTSLKDVPGALVENVTVLNDTLTDGDTWVINITAIDVMENKLTDSVVVHVDVSQPLIKNMYLVRDNFRYLFAHNSIDLSGMKVYFEAFDPHSGIWQIRWWLGTTFGDNDIGQGNMAVPRLSQNVRNVDA